MIASNQVTGNIGLFYVCYRLSQLGWNAMPTSRNARGIDVIAYNSDCSQMRKIQVKALRGRAPVPLGKSLDAMMGDFWIIVNNVGKDPSTFVMLPSEVKQRAHKGVRDGKISYWLQPKSYELNEFREAWQRLGQAS